MLNTKADSYQPCDKGTAFMRVEEVVLHRFPIRLGGRNGRGGLAERWENITTKILTGMIFSLTLSLWIMQYCWQWCQRRLCNIVSQKSVMANIVYKLRRFTDSNIWQPVLASRQGRDARYHGGKVPRRRLRQPLGEGRGGVAQRWHSSRAKRKVFMWRWML